MNFSFADLLLILLLVFVIVSFFILRKGKGSKKFYLFLFLVIFFLSFYIFRQDVLEFLKSIPFVWNILSPVFAEISSNSLLGLFYLSLFGSLFFISMPIEIVFIYYLTLDYNPLIILIIASVGSLLGLTFNYLFGLVLGERFLRFFLKAKFDKFKASIDKFGGFIIFFGNVIPSPVELATVVFGCTRYSFRKFLIYSLLGRVVKFGAIIWLGDFFNQKLIPYFKDLF